MSDPAGRPVFDGPVDALLTGRIVEHSLNSSGAGKVVDAPGADEADRGGAGPGSSSAAGWGRRVALLAAAVLFVSLIWVVVRPQRGHE